MAALALWGFRGYLVLLAAPYALWSLAAQAYETLRGFTRAPFRERMKDRLTGSFCWSTFQHTFVETFSMEHADGKGWSDEQLPRLWASCRALAQKMGMSPPDALHLTLEPCESMAWCSGKGTQVRRHIALSLLDLRLLTLDEARSVIAHEIAHLGKEHTLAEWRNRELVRSLLVVITALPFPLTLPVYACALVLAVGRHWGAHDDENEADRLAALAVGGNHAASALKKVYRDGPGLARVFRLLVERASTGARAPERLAEAALHVYRRYDFEKTRRIADDAALVPGESHPSLPERVANTRGRGDKTGVRPGEGFVDAFPEVLVAEELLTRTYFPDAPIHARSDASDLRRRALAARLKNR